MRHKAKVIRVIDENTALISVQRESACGHDCSSCGGCGMPAESVMAQAVNKVGAQPGDVITLETNTTAVIGIAAVVYLMPVLLFFVGYIALKVFCVSEFIAVFSGVLGFIIGLVCAFAVNKKVAADNDEMFTIVSIDSGEN